MPLRASRWMGAVGRRVQRSPGTCGSQSGRSGGLLRQEHGPLGDVRGCGLQVRQQGVCRGSGRGVGEERVRN